MNSSETPRSLGYRWPAEWEPHQATWIAWPHNQETWPGHFESVPSRFAEIVRILAQYEPVCVLAGGPAIMQQAEELIGHIANVTLFDVPTNDAWIRDYGPTFLLDSHSRQLAAVDWQFNSWGGKYPPWDRDNAVVAQLTAALDVPRFAPQAVMEGGAIDGNGDGVIITTRSCLLDPNRNKGMTRHAVERLLLEYCGARDVLWIAGGPVAGDDTDGHVDQLARFVSRRQMVVAVEENAEDENYQPLQANFRALQDARDRLGAAWEVIPLSMPKPIYVDGHRVPASYCNFYIANGCVLVPVFQDPADQRAIHCLENLFPDRDVIGVDCRTIVWGLGALHCLTQQQPAVTA